MTFFRLLRRNLLYHRRGNLAVLLGVALGTAVLTGALLVGDSLRGSLRELTLDRLGWVEEAMVPGHFFRAQLAHDLSPAARSDPAILLTGSASARDQARRVGGVTVLGVDARFWSDAPPEAASFWESDESAVVLNATLAGLLRVKEGDTVTLHLQKADDIPRESLLGKRKTKDVMQALELKVRQILPDKGLARFTLKPTPEPARNAFVPLRLLQSELGMQGQANAVLIARAAPMHDDDMRQGPTVEEQLRHGITLDDWGLRLRSPKDRALAFFHLLAPNGDDEQLKPARWRGRVPDELADAAEANKGLLTRGQVVAFYEKHRPYLSLESRQLYLPDVAVEAAYGAAANLSAGDNARPVVVQRILVYLVDTMSAGERSIPYVVVAGVDQTKIAGLKYANEWLGPHGIALALPTNEELPGSTIDLTYYVADDQHHLDKRHEAFDVVERIALAGPADDPDLTPEFPGITDQLDIGAWKNPPFPYDRKRVKLADEDYWRRYRATPRAYIGLTTAQRLWGSRFGDLTSMQFFGADAGRLAPAVLANLTPEQGGFVFQPLRANAKRASGGSTDFGVLFLGFSVFLIAAALLLVGLLVRLNLDRRASEIGLLLAIGWSHGRVLRLLLGEGAVLAVVGGAVGLGGALVYGRLMLDLLRVNWPGGESLNFLKLHAEPRSFAIGYFGALAVSMLTLFWATRVLGKLAPRALLAGETTPTSNAASGRGWPWAPWIVGLLSVLGAAACVVAGMFANGQEAKAGSFFGSGALLLTACLAGVQIWLRSTGRQNTPRPSLTALGIRNAGRHALRSLLTVGLLASATFLIVAVEAFHKESHADFADEHGHRLALIAETSVPIFQDLNQPAVRKELGLADNPLFAKVRFESCPLHGGDDASCLNLYRPLQPRVLGVQPQLLGRWNVPFAAPASTPSRPAWMALTQLLPDGSIPAALDANTAEWTMKKGLGATLEVDNGIGAKIKLRVAALLAESIFQSEVVVSAENFRMLYPRQEGYSFIFVECTDATDEEVKQIQSALETALADQGVRVQTPAERLQAYLAVENTYLATFQALGGLGLVLGAVGLAIVLLRGVWERRGELALLRALGFGSARLAWLVLAENLALLVLGLGAGTAAALLSVAPHLAGSGGQVLWLRIGVLLLLVLVTGLLAGGLAVLTTIRAPLLTALRRE